MKGHGSNKILLVGNPNVGKSVVFAFLTGRYAVVSNYPGTTVEVSSGLMGLNRTNEVIDTPGINSLFPKSEDEKVTRDILLHHRDAVVVQVADAKNLFRALLLTTQLAELGCRQVLVLNMMDEARQRGISIDTKKLSSSLGIEVIETVAVEKRGLPRLVSALNSGVASVPNIEVPYPALLEGAVNKAKAVLSDSAGDDLFGILTRLSGDRDFLGKYRGAAPDRIEELNGELDALESHLPNPFSYYIASGRKDLVERLLSGVAIRRFSEAVRRRGGPGLLLPVLVLAVISVFLYFLVGRSVLSDVGLHPTVLILLGAVLAITVAGADRTNRVTLHPLFGTLILLLVLYLVYMLVGVFAAGTLVDILESRLFGGLVIPAIGRLVGTGWLRDFLIGDYGLVSVGLTYSISIVLPIVTTFFLVFGILEDTGYFPRLTVLTNNVFRFVGVNGKATLPIVLGFGCVTMATLASRILDSRKERFIVVALLALAIPCSAQLGIIMALMSTISTGAVILIGCIIVVEFMLTGRLMSWLLKGRTSDFILELPPLRTPRLTNILLKTGARVNWFLKEALPFFLLATVIIYIFDKSGGLKLVYKVGEPIVSRFLGLPVETTAIFIVGFFRRDYGAAGLYKLWENGQLTGNQVVVALVMISLFIPCLATLIVMIKELGIRQAFAILLFVVLASILTGGLLNLALGSLGIEL